MKKSLMILNVVLLLLVISSAGSANSLNALIAYYPFNGNANDESGGGNHGTIYGAALTEDKFGNHETAYSFDGVDDYIFIGDKDSFENMSELTISLWTRFNSFGLGEGSELMPLVCKWKTLHDVNSFNLTEGGAGNQIRFIVDDRVNEEVITMDHNMHIGEWHMVSAVFNQGIMQLYLDGQLGVTYESVLTHIGNSPEPLKIGDWYQTYNSDYQTFDGDLDDVHIYNRALSSYEILELYNLPNPVPLPASMVLLGGGLAGLAGLRRNIRKWRG